jgi:hypothetical protein
MDAFPFLDSPFRNFANHAVSLLEFPEELLAVSRNDVKIVVREPTDLHKAIRVLDRMRFEGVGPSTDA